MVTRRLPLAQPAHLDVALTLLFQFPARTDAVEIAVEIDFQQDGRMKARCAFLFGLYVLKSKGL